MSSVSGPRLSKPVGDGMESGEVGGKQNKWLSSASSRRWWKTMRRRGFIVSAAGVAAVPLRRRDVLCQLTDTSKPVRNMHIGLPIELQRSSSSRRAMFQWPDNHGPPQHVRSCLVYNNSIRASSVMVTTTTMMIILPLLWGSDIGHTLTVARSSAGRVPVNSDPVHFYAWGRRCAAVLITSRDVNKATRYKAKVKAKARHS